MASLSLLSAALVTVMVPGRYGLVGVVVPTLSFSYFIIISSSSIMWALENSQKMHPPIISSYTALFDRPTMEMAHGLSVGVAALIARGACPVDFWGRGINICNVVLIEEPTLGHMMKPARRPIARY